MAATTHDLIDAFRATADALEAALEGAPEDLPPLTDASIDVDTFDEDGGQGQPLVLFESAWLNVYSWAHWLNQNRASNLDTETGAVQFDFEVPGKPGQIWQFAFLPDAPIRYRIVTPRVQVVEQLGVEETQAIQPVSVLDTQAIRPVPAAAGPAA